MPSSKLSPTDMIDEKYTLDLPNVDLQSIFLEWADDKDDIPGNDSGNENDGNDTIPAGKIPKGRTQRSKSTCGGDFYIDIPSHSEKPSKEKEKVKRHSIHGMMEEENVIRPHQEMAQLSLDEKKFLLAVERGDVASTRRMLQRATETGYININCVDPLGRSALLMAIDNENLEMVELLISHRVETKDALLHAISEQFVEAVEVLLDHEETLHKPDTPHSWEALPADTATFTPDVTPLILSAHRDNYEIIKILLDRGATLPMPHDVRCGCADCVRCRQEDSLRHSRSRINAYRALASPSLISLSSKDPILTAFELSWELRRLSFLEHEFKCEYQELRKQCQEFATALLDHTRSSYELEVLLNHDPTLPAFEHGERMHLNRLKLAIKLRQKKFVAHPNVQQLLASIWYEGLPGFRRKNMVLQAAEIIRIGCLFPVFSIAYIFAPHSSIGQTMRKPFIKFICHSASYFTFLFMLILASQRIETAIFNVLAIWSDGEEEEEIVSSVKRKDAPPTVVEWMILAWVSGLIWSEVKQLWDVGLEDYVNDMWNVIDFVTNSLYVATVALRMVTYYQAIKFPFYAETPREKLDSWDPMLISEGLFSAANIFSSLKLVYIFSVNPHLGPLQVSLSRMVMDIMKFLFLYVLVLFAFSCGLNQLLWYYAEETLEKRQCNMTGIFNSTRDTTACFVYRRFANLFETIQTLFWAVFGLVDLDSFELDGILNFTRFWGMLMFGTYSVINIVVLLNLLIAMMNHSYQLISRKVEQANERDIRYQNIMRNLVRRYVTVEQRKAESQGVTEDDVNEIKQDISAFRCELIEILKNSGMNTSTASGIGAASGGKKNRQKERRLMKGFNIAPTPPTSATLPPVAEFIASLYGNNSVISRTSSPKKALSFQHARSESSENGIFGHSFQLGSGRVGRSTPSHKRRWGTLIEAAKSGRVSRFIGRSRSEDSVCNSHHGSQEGARSHSNSPASDDNCCTESPTDSNPSLDLPDDHGHSDGHNQSGKRSNGEGREQRRPQPSTVTHSYYGIGALTALKRKRKKFYASRNASPVIIPSPSTNVEHPFALAMAKGTRKVLKRASSVPIRVTEVVQMVMSQQKHHHHASNSQQNVDLESGNAHGNLPHHQSMPIPSPPRCRSTLTPSTTEESVTNAGNPHNYATSSREPLLTSSSTTATGSAQTPDDEDDDEYKNQMPPLPKLPGVVPISGHNITTGWL